MKRWFMVIAGFVVAVNLWVYSTVIYNRYGTAPLSITLTERELVLPLRNSPEDSGLSLRLSWQGNVVDRNRWFRRQGVILPEGRLEQLPFAAAECQQPPNHWPQRKDTAPGWLLLEYNGEAYEQLLVGYDALREELIHMADKTPKQEQELLNVQKQLIELQQGDSRLIAVDAASSRQPLQKAAKALQAPSLILPATLEAGNGCITNHIYARLEPPVTVYVAAHWRNHLPQRSSHQSLPRYEVDLAFGALWRPWIDRITACPAGECASDLSAPVALGSAHRPVE